VLVALIFAGIDEVQMDGDMVPVYAHFRWQPKQADLVDAYRKEHPAVAVTASATGLEPTAEDFPAFRNRDRDGVVTGPPLARDWKAKPPRMIWKKPCGTGFSGFAVVAGRAVTMEQRREDETIVCYDTATGDELWSHGYPARFYDPRGGEGPMVTPTIDRGLVFTLGGTGRLTCLDFATGELKWEKQLLEPGQNLMWGMAGSPLVYDEVVVVSPGGQHNRGEGKALIAFNRTSGEQVWGSGSTPAGYSSPMLATLHGKRQVVILDGVEVAGYDAEGKGKLWSYPWKTNLGINVAQPLVLPEDKVFVTSGYGVGCDVVETVEGKVQDEAGKEPNHPKTMQGKFASPLDYKGLIYGLSEGQLRCIEPEKLSLVWSGARYGHGQILRCEDLLLVLSEKGELALVQAAGAKSKELGRIKVLAGDKTWNYPCLAGGKAYIRNHVEMACYDLRE
jgi:outer membrane protein assembly factor BamB